MAKNKCKHPPARLYSWLAEDVLNLKSGKSLVVVCLDCRAILRGSAEEYEARLEMARLAGTKLYISGRPVKTP